MQHAQDLQTTRKDLGNENQDLAADKDSLGRKILMSILGITFAVMISGSIPFIMAYFSKGSENKPAYAMEAPSSNFNLKHMEAFVWAARLKLQEFRLHHRLGVGTNEQEALEIIGAVSKEEHESWIEFLDWYTTREGFPPLDHKVTATAISGNIPQLQSVWFGSNPTAYFQDGSFGNIGTDIQDGWKIIGIEPWAVFVERDRVIVTLGYE